MFDWGKKKVERTEEEQYVSYVGSKQYFDDCDFEQGIKDGHAKIYGNNSLEGLDFNATLNALIQDHVQQFKNGAKFPSQYKHFLKASDEEGYETARYGSVYNCRKVMIESRRHLVNNFESFGLGANGEIVSQKILTREGLDILAQCEAYDIAERKMRQAKDTHYLSDYTDKRKFKQKMYDKEPIVISSGNADIKRDELNLQLADFERATVSVEDTPDLIDGFKKFFGF